MALAPKQTMTVDEFLEWADTQDEGRYELFDGVVIAMSPQRAFHVRSKETAQAELRAAIARKNAPCESSLDGLAVRIDEKTSFVPDIVVNCGERVADIQMVAPNPVIVVEVLSPSTQQVDKSRKLIGYFRVPGLIHYLIIDVEKRAIIHHRRKGETSIDTTLIRKGTIALEPPGIEIQAERLLG
jgi:Uma2 family endonuclease